MAQYSIGNNTVIISQGDINLTDIKLNVTYQGEERTQFKDKTLFSWISNLVQNRDEGQEFLNIFRDVPSICFNGTHNAINTITVSPMHENAIDAYNYCNQLDKSDDFKFILLILILRCYVDFNGYSNLNGCKRIFGQILLLLSYKFDGEYHIGYPTLTNGDVCQAIHSLGFIKGQAGITIFNSLYNQFIDNNYQLLKGN